ncbi:MAG TPA: hypothetical protein PLM88_07940 [Bacillota bacterium]|nr:hypothetical protein [Bacillota bacterium]HOH10965.1 hypothetical protein [Bacillota bacterium]HOY89213.1 hypothetical protein [Bacillota bacterium]HPM64441.1 hypothetical protein [Bacillota bacterium]
MRLRPGPVSDPAGPGRPPDRELEPMPLKMAEKERTPLNEAGIAYSCLIGYPHEGKEEILDD